MIDTVSKHAELAVSAMRRLLHRKRDRESYMVPSRPDTCMYRQLPIYIWCCSKIIFQMLYIQRQHVLPKVFCKARLQYLLH